MPHFHIPLQSGSDEVLRLMHRRYDKALFAHKIQLIKEKMPNAFIGVDVMVGCRGEKPELFDECYRFLDGLDVTQLHVFPYSERPGTAALRIPYTVDEQEKKRRSKLLLDMSDRKLHAFYEAHIGHDTEVLFEKATRGKAMHGFTPDYVRVELPARLADESLDNMIVKENITVDDDVRAELAKQFPEATAEQLAQLKTYGHYINSNKGVVRGLQANATVSLTDDLSLIVNYAYTNGRSKTSGTWTVLERTFKNSLTAGLNYNHTWRNYTLGVNLNGRFQSATYYPAYEDAPGYGVINLNTTHTFTVGRMFKLVPSIGIDNIFDKTDHRIDTPSQKVALYSPGRMLVVGLKVNFAK